MVEGKDLSPSDSKANIEKCYVSDFENETFASTLTGDTDDKSVDKGLFRSQLASLVSGTSDMINNNLIIARYGIICSITVLTLYGISQTPLFFRYRKLSEIPQSYFHQRRSISCRVVSIVKTNHQSHSKKQQQHIKKVSFFK